MLTGQTQVGRGEAKYKKEFFFMPLFMEGDKMSWEGETFLL